MQPDSYGMMTNVPGSDRSQPSGRVSHEADDDPRPTKKQRRQRPSLSCAECRRLKMKCDRQLPCSNCVRRRRTSFCNPGAADTTPSRGSDTPKKQRKSPAQAEHPPTQEDNAPRSPDIPRLDHPSIHIWDTPPQHDVSQHRGQAHITAAEQGSADHSGRNSRQPPHNGNRRDDFEQLALLDHALQSDPVHESSSAASGRISLSGPSDRRNSGYQNPVPQPLGVAGQNGSYGTLMLGKGGRSKYLGPTAGSEWLKESETQDASDSPPVTRAPSPKIPDSVPSQPYRLTPGTTPIAFPFNVAASHVSTRELLSRLPTKEEAETLVGSYYRYCAWHHDVAPKASFQKTFDRIYKFAEGVSVSPRVNPQEIALVFIVLAQGTLFNIEMPNYDPSAEDWLHLSELALVKGRFLSNNMVAGLQTLHLMAHLHLHLDKGGRGDNAWPLWGLVMRLVQAMGMHRDGARWNLPPDVIEERRKVFWELNAADTFQAHCFSRPCAMNPEHCDVAFPSEPENATGEKSYSILRFELSQLSSEILHMAMKVHKPPYSAVTDLDIRLGEFERNLPFSLRCRAAFLSMPSRYPHVEAAIEASPEPSRRSMTISFQQMNLALNISETIINLHRPYYAKALYDINDRMRSVYAPSFLTVIERCAIIIAIVDDIHTRFPAVSTRQWNFWYHVFGSALCLGTLVLRDPSNPMAAFALTQLDAAINLFTSLIQYGANTPRYGRNLQWLTRLRARASAKIASASTQPAAAQDDAGRRGDRDREDSEDVELLGWRTRLIERAGQGRQTIRTTIQLADETPTDSPHGIDVGSNPSPNDLHHHPFGVLQRDPSMIVAGSSLPVVTPDSTNELLQDFWDPMLLQDLLGSIPLG
ncbi:uncharacterized protein BO72DRAFT_477267 [Aspergillus fijiensis CBS 313.89]|uniref:Zn(2)-C6 fungal-type domain-containing protein n=1 Tax=Aspergillus fijiensis CBS 313.89 TaxID=1448319 RepID=A0A8G1RQN2_9EURO|nr:uncharacterized protein BO72DRAFT_477267 [Aspergillus fijiensis CBS 313.89]RAK77690.1 hypothetical protein BO72DRAFT_477267 [Aspergillus fijiensis CBS 313.89]